MKIIFTLIVFGITFSAFSQVPDSTVYELRIYKTAEGKKEVLTSIIQNPMAKLLETHGMKPVGFWVDADSNKVIYIVAHASKTSMANSWKNLNAGPAWTDVQGRLTKDGRVVLSVESIPMQGAGIMSAIKSSTQPVRFELRTYECFPERLPNLIARFKARSTVILAKHHMESVAYWTTIEKAGVQPDLVYILIHQNAEAKIENWKAFQADPEWISFRDASEKDGKIVKKVTSVNMTLIPTR